MRSRIKYWSDCKLAQAIRPKPFPVPKTMDQWTEWNKKYQAEQPIRYWITEVLFDGLQDIIHFPADTFYSAKYWFLNRFVTRTHTLKSNLPKGQWWDLDTRILHCLFDELVNYVELEAAWSWILWNPEKRVEYSAPWYSLGYFRTRTWRSKEKEAGLAHLEWSANLGEENNTQREAAREILTLYKWWTEVYPNRPDIYEGFDSTRLDYFAVDSITKKELQYKSEEEEMLIRLIKVRGHLWT